MVIKRLGHSSFRIKGSQGTIITDPFAQEAVGFKFPRTGADIVTVSHQHADHNRVDNVEGDPFVIDGPGEYEVKGVRIHGMASFHDAEKGALRGKNVMYLFHLDDLSLLHCGDLGHVLAQGQIDGLDEVDILLVPVGGVYTINAGVAAGIVAKLDPKIVIPMHYREERLNRQTFGKLQKVEDFLSEIGQEEAKRQDKLVISKSKLPDETEVIVLK